jgi:hypothetical protein
MPYFQDKLADERHKVTRALGAANAAKQEAIAARSELRKCKQKLADLEASRDITGRSIAKEWNRWMIGRAEQDLEILRNMRRDLHKELAQRKLVGGITT